MIVECAFDYNAANLTEASKTMKSAILRSATLAMIAAFASLGSADDGKVKRDGFDLYYRTEGSGTPLVILSGGPGLEVGYMKPIGAFLPAGYQKVYLEQRGTGRSQPPTISKETMTLKLVVEDLEALRIALKQDRLNLLGHSWGGMLAMAYAAAHPDRVDRMILLGSGGCTLEFVQWFEDNITARMRPEDVAAQEHWEKEGKSGVDPEKVELESLRAKCPAYFFNRDKGLAFAKSLTDGALHVQVGGLLFQDLAKEYDLRAGLRKFKRPVLIVQGHQDPIGDVTAREIHDTIDGSQLLFLSKCGHFAWLERPDEFRKAVAEFLKK
ncbi:MAG: alpha/beta hydrolase [Armatimonadetes bacterium]|nr:alpha/beta hydrolase [Armatimonadota bacterium]